MAQTRPMPLLLRTYLGATQMIPGLLTRPARKAHTRLGCDPARLPERFGQPTQPRPEGPLIWLNAASVGELVSVFDLMQDMQAETGAAVLVTTMTQTSAQLAARRLPQGAIHQFIPVDTPAAVRGFLDHWRPDLACFVESDIWPRLVLESQARDIPLALINARPSSSRKKAPKTMGYLLSCFDRFTAQDDETTAQLRALHLAPARIATTGDLKSAAAPLPCDARILAELQAQLGARPLWLAASTHPGEEEQVLEAHKLVLAQHPQQILTLIPRHPERGAEIANLLESKGFSFSSRSRGQLITPQTQVYLADTLGEMGVFFTLAPLAFMGASFTDEGGHNPFEPAQLGCAVLHGPKVKNFANDYNILDETGAAFCVQTPQALAAQVLRLTGSATLTRMQQTGLDLMAERRGIRTAVMDHLRPLLPAPRPAPRVAP